ncbi:MAG TPA: hypothetical protein VK843_03290 [Planctomycetota bacterium]|nr:hypothetical protein [Planctomycetota bacterium]
MNLLILAVHASIVGCLIPSPAIAQVGSQYLLTQMQGMFSNSAVGVTFKDLAGVETLGIRSAGVVNNVDPADWDATRFGPASLIHPDYSKVELLKGINLLSPSGPPAQTLGFGGFSTGGDVCPHIDNQGKLVFTNTWYFLSITVGAQPLGHVYGKAGTALNSLTKPKQAFISYYVEGSTGIDLVLVNSTVIEQTGTQLGFLPTSDVEVTGIDLGMGAISSDQFGTRTRLFSPVRDELYFTPTPEWVALNNTHKVGGAVLNSKTIYRMQWLATGTNSWAWSAPTVAVTPDELFGVGNHANKVIDALSVHSNLVGTAFTRVVFSTTLASGSPGELLGYDSANGSPAMPLRTPINNVLVAERIGLHLAGDPEGIDNVTGTCGGDPDPDSFDSVIGYPITRFDLNEPKPLGMAVYRSMTPAFGDRVDMQVSGLQVPTTGNYEVRFQVGSYYPIIGQTPYWFPIGSVPALSTSTTANFTYPGGYGPLGKVSVTAGLFLVGASNPIKTSLVSVLDY